MSTSAPHPRMHGLTHVAGGSDPVPFLPMYPTGDTMDEKILAALPAGFWKLNETSGSIAADSSGNGQDLSTSGIEVDPLWGQPAGPPGEPSAGFNTPAGADPGALGTACRVSRSWPAITGSFTAGVWVNRTSNLQCYVMGQVGPGAGSGWQLNVNAYNVSGAENKPEVVMKRTSGVEQVVALNPLPVGTWAFLAVAYDHTLGQYKLYVDGLLQGTSGTFTFVPAVGTTPRLYVGHIGQLQHGRSDMAGSYAFLVNRAMSGTELEGIVNSDPVGTPPDTTGLVLGIDENGNPAWIEQTVEVSGGGLDDTTPDPTPVDSDSGPFAGTPTTGTGWHLEAHTEIVFLVDSTRGRFDVPSMKWTRVPFNTIRILRTWEPTVDADVVKTAWLPDDRGLSGPARDGVLHVNADMAWSGDQLVQGWVSIEYPVLDPHGLPDDDPEIPGFGPRPEAPTPGLAAEDSYMRALRPFNLSAGSPLHMPSSGDPAFLTWHFWDEAHVMEPGGYPPPTYPVWDARPLHLPPPYPQLSPTDSRGYYVDSVGNPGWMFDKLSVATTLSAGANLCLQAWQDSPWLIRFSTDRFPAYHGYTGTYRGFPYLYISFAYDPDTIDHTTGKLLLPAP